MTDDLAALRRSYDVGALEEVDLDPDPLRLFRRWFSDAQSSAEEEANAMTLATVDVDGRPDARVVLLKGLDDRGFVWFSNYRSAKGEQLDANPDAALVFRWQRLERQVRVRGRVQPTSEEESDAYFATRPLGSQIGAIVSAQSQPITDRTALEEAAARLVEGPPAAIVRPLHWGGFRLVPAVIEFWQGRPNRLHDRFRFSRPEPSIPWSVVRLSP